ncbi:MAG: hypothetical protein M1829_005084 [Trizodia sp. TS-e1964]|nr:MAG: hypothetical protein M1829_005084 [Trizodia sp. TS-e1964]
MDTGGLAQMTYSNFPSNGALGVPGSGFATRGKGSHIKRLSFISATAAENARPSGATSSAASTPRTSRSHLLAGLRTAPKSPGLPPPSAPPLQSQHRMGLDASRYADQENMRSSNSFPKTSTASSFPSRQISGYEASLSAARQMYSLPEQVLAPPAIQIGGEHGDEGMDPNLYAELVAQNLYLAQQQQRLQQQLINVTAAAQQFQGLNIVNQMSMPQQQQYLHSPIHPSMGFYNQQMQTGMQPVLTPILGAQPGLYSVYNPMTGQHGYFLDPSSQQSSPFSATTPTSSQDSKTSPSQPATPQFRAQVSPPPPSSSGISKPVAQRSISPPKITTLSDDVSPLPPPSANAFRRGHKKSSSLISCVNASSLTANSDGPKTAMVKPVGFPSTPLSGTFGPGQARVGEHPIRQPRGPPPLDDLLAKPTTKHEGSKNFATRQRRRAVHSLVRAGIERRGVRTGSGGSSGSLTPVSETEITFSISSDNDSDNGSLHSGSLTGKQSLGSIRAIANGAIGSERVMKDRSRERGSGDSVWTVRSHSSNDNSPTSGNLGPDSAEMRKTPMLVLTSAEKRKSAVF